MKGNVAMHSLQIAVFLIGILISVATVSGYEISAGGRSLTSKSSRDGKNSGTGKPKNQHSQKGHAKSGRKLTQSGGDNQGTLEDIFGETPILGVEEDFYFEPTVDDRPRSIGGSVGEGKNLLEDIRKNVDQLLAWKASVLGGEDGQVLKEDENLGDDIPNGNVDETKKGRDDKDSGHESKKNITNKESPDKKKQKNDTKKSTKEDDEYELKKSTTEEENEDSSKANLKEETKKSTPEIEVKNEPTAKMVEGEDKDNSNINYKHKHAKHEIKDSLTNKEHKFKKSTNNREFKDESKEELKYERKKRTTERDLKEWKKDTDKKFMRKSERNVDKKVKGKSNIKRREVEEDGSKHITKEKENKA